MITLKNNLFKLFLVSTLGLFFSCGSVKNTETKPQPEAEKPEAEIAETYFIIGEGGGFTGVYEQYKISNNGTVAAWDGTTSKSSTETQMLGKKTTAKFFNDLEKLNIAGMQLNQPGNMNYSINLVTPNGASTILWSDNFSPSIEVLTFYKEVMNTIRNLK